MLVVIVVMIGIVVTVMMVTVDSGGGGCDVMLLDVSSWRYLSHPLFNVLQKKKYMF